MAADTAYLEGGPCAKTTHKLTAAESDSGTLVCKGGLYKNAYSAHLHHGDIVFRYAGKASGTGGGGSGSLNAPQALKGWHDIRHSVNTAMPHSLQQAERVTRRALQVLAHTRKVKG